ncbi:hypothetical protein [Streptomyces roseochromogenus]|uniref:hypothetical protein n=1 Tax=Streptomyces roseochromogenus TaxID=285450 RepID=UPI000A66D961|nr:hypothetical protein [Streptomyces roseochromogenus]
MSDGFFHWYRSGWVPADAERVVQDLDAQGLRLNNPTTGRITQITSGPESWGEQVPVSRDQLMSNAALTNAGEVNFQLWLSGDTDIFTRIRRLNGGVTVFEFGLDGLSLEEQEHAIRAISRQICADLTRCIGFVLDRQGVTEDVDWDDVIMHGANHLDSWPDTLAVRPDISIRHPQLAAAKRMEMPPLILVGEMLPGNGPEL